MAFLIILTLFLSLASADGDGVDKKRLLLTDPNLLNDRLMKLENSINQLQQINQQQEDTIRRLENSRSNTGTTYTRWGRSTCPGNNTELVYAGYVGGGIYSEKGSSPNLLCVTQNPLFQKTSGPNFAHLYGAEYDDDFYGPHANGEDMPCAVCYKKTATSSVMIPGRNKCYAGWEEAYYGYLTTEGYTSNGADYICVDINPEYLVAGEVNTNAGRMLGPVLAKCGILKCPPYHDNYPITCVVCSK